MSNQALTVPQWTSLAFTMPLDQAQDGNYCNISLLVMELTKWASASLL